MKNNFLVELTYDSVGGQVRLNAYKLLSDFQKTLDAINSKHPSLRPFASYGLSQDELDDLTTSIEEGSNVDHLVMAYDFEDYFDTPFLPEGVEEFIGSLEHYAKQDELESK